MGAARRGLVVVIQKPRPEDGTFAQPDPTRKAINNPHDLPDRFLPPTFEASAMLTSFAWLALSLVLAAPPSRIADQRSPGWKLWQQGQEAMQRDELARAIDFFEESLATDPLLTRNYLSLAAAWLGKGDDNKACLYLTLYVAAHPEHRAVRLQYVDLLHRLRRLSEARDELECFIADAQEQAAEDDSLIQGHSRLLQLAEQREDSYEEHLHRGIGLFLLSRQRGQFGGEVGELDTEGLLCKSAAELTLAARERPGEARPFYYLHRVWSKLAQSQPAGRCLRAAEKSAPFTYLTPAEQRQLSDTCRDRDRFASRR
jgi:tetratricopeptide (TPR) repeat protein